MSAPTEQAQEGPDVDAGRTRNGSACLKAVGAREGSRDLRAYAQAKHDVAHIIRSLQHFLSLRKSDERGAKCQELLVKLAEDRFTLAVVGQFKRGKSSLMNAIVGRELLPTGVLPLTSAITILRFGPSERILISHTGSQYYAEAAVSQLLEYVTEKGNPGNHKGIEAVYVEVNSPFLRRGLEFVDTPGIGSSIEANTATTEEFIPKCDAVLFVTSTETPLTSTELEFLAQIRQHVRKIFFVLNKTDLLSGDEQQEVLTFVRDTLTRASGAENVMLFPVSSKLAMSAKAASNGGVELESGLYSLEAALARFLSTERTAVLLAATLDKVLRLLEEEALEVELELGLANDSNERIAERAARLEERFQALREEREARFFRIRREVHASLLEGHYKVLLSALSGAKERLLRLLHRVLRRTRLRSSGAVAAKIAASTKRTFDRLLSDWTDSHAHAIRTELQEFLQRESKALEADHLAITTAASEVVGATRSQHTDFDDTILARSIGEFSYKGAPALECPKPAYSWPWLPAGVNPKLRCELEKSVAQISQTGTDCLGDLSQRVDDWLDRLRAFVESDVGRSERRVLELLCERNSNRANGQLSVNEQREELLALRQKLTALRTRLIEPFGHSELESELQLVEPTPRASALIGTRPLRSVSVMADLRSRGCPVCNHVRSAMFEFFADWQYRLSKDERSRIAYARELGFCPLHVWQLASLSSPIGLSIGLSDLTARISKELCTLSKRDGTVVDELCALLRKRDECRACRFMRERENDYLAHIAQHVDRPEFRGTFLRSQGMCLRHLTLAAPLLEPRSLRFLLDKVSEQCEEMSEDMQSYVMRRDALRRNLNNRDEDDAYLRAMALIAGDRSLCTPWVRDADEL